MCPSSTFPPSGIPSGSQARTSRRTPALPTPATPTRRRSQKNLPERDACQQCKRCRKRKTGPRSLRRLGKATLVSQTSLGAPLPGSQFRTAITVWRLLRLVLSTAADRRLHGRLNMHPINAMKRRLAAICLPQNLQKGTRQLCYASLGTATRSYSSLHPATETLGRPLEDRHHSSPARF